MSENILHTGIYGKLPAHGDFVTRHLPASFVNHWDDWLQKSIRISQERLGDDWLGIYLTSPIWRFTLSSGVIDNNYWTGVMLPSVDRVGRYFPFTILCKLDSTVNLFEFISTQNSWFNALENLALQGLEGLMDVDEISRQLDMLEFYDHRIYKPDTVERTQNNIYFELDFEEQLPSTVYSQLLEQLSRQNPASYSLWHTAGSELVKPSFIYSNGLPTTRGVTAFMDGEWQKHDWFIPYQLLHEDQEITIQMD